MPHLYNYRGNSFASPPIYLFINQTNRCTITIFRFWFHTENCMGEKNSNATTVTQFSFTCQLVGVIRSISFIELVILHATYTFLLSRSRVYFFPNRLNDFDFRTALAIDIKQYLRNVGFPNGISFRMLI